LLHIFLVRRLQGFLRLAHGWLLCNIPRISPVAAQCVIPLHHSQGFPMKQGVLTNGRVQLHNLQHYLLIDLFLSFSV
jgi:hypothetical protein